MSAIRIERIAEGETLVLRISGQLSEGRIPQLQSEMTDKDVVLDLEEVTLVSGEVIRFLRICELQGVQLRNCPLYVREWISRVSDDPGSPTDESSPNRAIETGL